MPANRKRRMPNQKEPIGKTKSLILVYVANNPNCTMTDIRGYSRDDLNIRNPKGIRGHVSALVSDNLIQKKAVGKGLSDQYYIESTFTVFRNCFNYLHANGFSVDFLQTEFSKSLLSDDEFFLFGLVNIVKETVSDLLSLMKDENRFNDLLLEASKEGMNKQIEMMKEQRVKLLEQNMSEFVLGLASNTAEELLLKAQDIFPIPIKPVLGGIISEIFSQMQKEEIINILSTSPSAMDYFLNLKTENKMMFLTALMRFFIGILFVDPSKAVIVNSFNKEPNKMQSLSLITQLFSTKNIVNQNPILTTLKAHFIIDAVSGKIIENEYSTKALTHILIPEVIQ